MSTLIIGLGNPFLGDDGVGIVIAQLIRGKISDNSVTVVTASAAGLDLLDRIVGYDRVIIIDSVVTGRGKVGSLYRWTPHHFRSTVNLDSPHGINLATALEIGKRMGLKLPKEVKIYAIKVANRQAYGDSLSPRIAKVVPQIAEKVIKEILKTKLA